MANGASRIFNIVKNTSNMNNQSSKLVTLEVKTLNPLSFILDNRIILTSEFIQLDNNIDISKLRVGIKLSAISLNEEQLYYVQANDSVKKDNTDALLELINSLQTEINSLKQRVTTLENKVNNLENQ